VYVACAKCASKCIKGHTQHPHIHTRAGADVNRASGMGCTPLHWACRGGWVSVVEALTAAHADVNRATGMGCTPLHWGSREGQVWHRDCLLQGLAQGIGRFAPA
jgi:ankyrin repeat protein